jgi:hypothetical protein
MEIDHTESEIPIYLEDVRTIYREEIRSVEGLINKRDVKDNKILLLCSIVGFLGTMSLIQSYNIEQGVKRHKELPIEIRKYDINIDGKLDLGEISSMYGDGRR